MKQKLLQVHLSLDKKEIYITPLMKFYPRNGWLGDPNSTRHKLYHHKQYQYLQHPVLWVVLNISAIVLMIRLKDCCRNIL